MINCMEPIVRRGCGDRSTNLMLHFITLEFSRFGRRARFAATSDEFQLRAALQPTQVIEAAFQVEKRHRVGKRRFSFSEQLPHHCRALLTLSHGRNTAFVQKAFITHLNSRAATTAATTSGRLVVLLAMCVASLLHKIFK